MVLILLVKTIPGIIEENDLIATGGVGTVTVFLPKTLGAQAVGAVGNVNVQLPATVNQALTGSVATGGVASVHYLPMSQRSTLLLLIGSGNVYYVNGTPQATMNLLEGNIYHFDQSDSTNSGHPLRFQQHLTEHMVVV